tara:strand:- start:132 stop:614 length:483 start_codon:yes stop_codon:yes gene_type:complete
MNLSLKKSIIDWLKEYSYYHKNPKNKIIHWVCIPLIMFSVFGLLSLIKFDLFILGMRLSLFHFSILAASYFYLKLSLKISIGMIIFISPMIIIIDIINSLYSTKILFFTYLSIFILSWVLQFIGHKIEGKKPAFAKDLKFLLIGPAWMIAFIYKKNKIKI